MVLLLACTPPETGHDDTQVLAESGDSDTAWDTAWELNGSWPPEPVPLTEFVAHNMDGSQRSAENLDGHVTVMWFYPAAATFG